MILYGLSIKENNPNLSGEEIADIVFKQFGLEDK